MLEARTQEGRKVPLESFSVHLALGKTARWIVRGNVPEEILTSFAALSIHAEAASGTYTIEGLRPQASGSQWIELVRAPVPSTQPMAMNWRLTQRVTQPLEALVKSWVSPQTVNPPMARHVPARCVDMALPPGAVLIAPPATSPWGRLLSLDGQLRQEGCAASGLFDAGQPDGDWTWAGRQVGNDPNHVCTLSAEVWRLGHSEYARHWAYRGQRSLTRNLRLHANQQVEWLQQLGEWFDIDTNERIPLRPMSVLLPHKQHAYLQALTLTVIDSDAVVSSGEGLDPNTFLDLPLADDMAPSPEASTLSRLRVLGRFAGWSGDRKWMMVEAPGQNTPPVAGFPPWQIEGASSLWAILLTPGFSGDKHSAFCVGWKLGDWLVLDVRDGSPPLVLGALQQQRAVAEGAVQLHGSEVTLATVNAQGDPTGTVANVGEQAISLEATEEITAMQGALKIAAGSINVAAATSFADAVDIAGDASFSSQVTVA